MSTRTASLENYFETFRRFALEDWLVGAFFIMHVLLWVVARYFQCAIILGFIEFLDPVDINIWE